MRLPFVVPGPQLLCDKCRTNCYILRLPPNVTPDEFKVGAHVLMRTCLAGMLDDREVLGFDHTQAL